MRVRLLLGAVGGALCACHDENAERYARAHAGYEALVNRAERPDSKAFERVLADLDAVENSPHADEARRLAAAIRRARSPTPPTPLALSPPPGSRAPELEAQLAACARLAKLAGLDGGPDRRMLEALEDCRRRAEKIDVRLAHCDEHDLELDGGH